MIEVRECAHCGRSKAKDKEWSMVFSHEDGKYVWVCSQYCRDEVIEYYRTIDDALPF